MGSTTSRSSAQLPRRTKTRREAADLISIAALSTVIRSLPAELVQQQDRVLVNKVVLCFEIELSKAEVGTWLSVYNQRNSPQLMHALR